MHHDKSLTLSAEYLLLLLDDAKGRLVIDSSTADIGLSGAVLLDLIAQGHLILEETDHKPGKQRLRAVGAGPADEDLAEACRKVEGRRFGKAIEILSGWAGFRSPAKSLRENELRRLVAAGILVEEQAKVLGIFPVDRFPTRDDSLERGIRRRAEDVLVRGAHARRADRCPDRPAARDGSPAEGVP